MYTKRLWHPTSGESRVFHDHETPSADWLDHHPNDPNADKVDSTVKRDAEADAIVRANAGKLPMTRDEIKSALDAAEIPYAPNAKDKTLYDLLVKSLVAHLTENNIPFPEDADAKQLLALVPPVTE